MVGVAGVVFDSNPVPMWIYDLATLRFLEVNAAAVLRYGYTRAEFLQMTLCDIRPPEDIDQLLENVSRVSDGFDHAGIWRHRSKSGEVLFVEITSCVLIYNERKAELVLAFDVTDRIALVASIRQREAEFRRFVTEAPVALAMLDLKMRYIATSSLWCEIFDLQGMDLRGVRHDFVLPDVTPGLHKATLDVIGGHAQIENTERVRRLSGRQQWFHWQVKPWRDEAGSPSGAIVFIEDVTLHVLAEGRLKQAAIVFETTRDGIVVTDAGARIVAVNRAYCDITGFEEGELLAKNPNLLKSGRHDKAFYQSLWHNLVSCGRWEGEIWNRRKDGELYPQWLSISSIRDDVGKISNYVGVVTDMSRLREAEERLNEAAHRDSLTGLPNRLHAFSRISHAIDLAKRQNRAVALLFVDLDQFRTVNDSLGHTVGDELLLMFSRRVSERLRDVDLFARLGGDDFIVLLESVSAPADAANVADALIRMSDLPYVLPHMEDVYLGVSVGISMSPGDAKDAEELLRYSELAMYKAKKEGRSAFRFHTAALSEAARERLSMENRLRRVIAHRALSVHFQPLVAGRDSCVVGVEALARWIPADGPEIPPGRFIPLAEENGTIIQIGAWILREACASVMRWSEACGFGGVVAVNLSARQFDQPDLVELVARTLSETGLPPERLELELTESMLMTDPARASATLFQLKNLGVKLSIDDFGTGYSSLSQLKRFPIDKLKIDRSFIEGLPDDRESRLITSAVIAMAHRLEITVLAEGVETAAQHDYLLEEGCDAFQGFMFSRPLPGNGALKFLSEWGKSAF